MEEGWQNVDYYSRMSNVGERLLRLNWKGGHPAAAAAAGCEFETVTNRTAAPRVWQSLAIVWLVLDESRNSSCMLENRTFKDIKADHSQNNCHDT